MHILSASVTQLQKIFAADVGHKVSEGTIGGDDFAAQSMLVESGSDQVEPNQFIPVQFRSNAASSPRRGPRARRPGKDVAPMESGRQGSADHPVAIRNLRAASIPSRSSTSVISPLSGSTKYWPRFDFTTTALRVLPTPGSMTATNTVPAGSRESHHTGSGHRRGLRTA